MADNFLFFSEIVPIDNAQQQAWIEQVLQATDVTDTQEQVLREAGLRLGVIDLEFWPGFEWRLQSRDAGPVELWVFADDSGNVDHLAELVRAFLARFRPTDCWQLTWSETCSKPRVGEFGGGGVFVTARSVSAVRAHDWIQRRRHAFDRRKMLSSR